MDIKKPARFDRIGHRITRNRTGQSNSRPSLSQSDRRAEGIPNPPVQLASAARLYKISDAHQQIGLTEDNLLRLRT